MEKECACPEAAAAINSSVSATCPEEEMIHLSRPSAPGPRDQDEDHVVQFHVNPGVTVSLQVGDSVRVVKGPMTVPMVPTAGRPSQPPIPMPVQVPVGHVVHQIMDETGQLRHVFLSTQRPPEGQPPPPPHDFYHAYYTVPHMPPHMPIPQPPPVRTDDRCRMQRDKLKKRVEQRHGGNPTSPLTSPTKKPPVRRPKEASSPPPAASTPGLQLSVCDVQQSSANLSWAATDSASVSGSEDSGVAETAPETCTTMYQLSIGKKGKEQKILYFGTDLCFQLDNLLPGTEYSVRLAAVPAGEGGTASGTAYTSFTTQPAAPSTPPAPRLAGRTKTSLTLKWSSCSNGGASLTAYILEIADKPEGVWRSVYVGREKQFVATKLQPGKTFCFRLAAENSLGQSPFCTPVAFNTQEPPPAAPNPPHLAAPALPDRLLLAWDPVKDADAYKLDQAEESSSHGPSFYAVHHGPECQFECRNLQPASAYLFRLKVEGKGQLSQASATARHVTAPAPPIPPGRPQIKGRPQSQSVRLNWAPPLHNGGAPVLAYQLQVDQGEGFQDVWSGPGCEAAISELTPGSTYMVRVAATNVAGQSMFSDAARVTTTAAPPGPPTWARRQQVASAHAAALRWSAPTIDGGAPVVSYEVEVSDGQTRRSVYQGTEPFCVAVNLQAATNHLFWVRAVNAAGAGPWAPELSLETAVAPPAAPEPPSVDVNDDGVAAFLWSPLLAAVTYGLQLALLEEPSAEPHYKQEYSGTESNCQVASLAPGSTYLARLQGLNSSGAGPFSTPVVFCTPVSVPGPVIHAPRRLSLESDGQEAHLVVTFEQPTHWGGDPQGPRTFQLEAVPAQPDASIFINTTEPTATIVLPLESSFRLRVRAVNSKGQGPVSPLLKVTTPPPPPPPPKLRLLIAQPRALRLAWESEDEACVVVEMRRMESHKFKVVYEGYEKGCKVSQLQRNTDYQFRTRAEGPGGQGSVGPVVTFRTRSAPVPLPSNFAVSEVTANSFLVSWQAPPEHKSKIQLGTSRHGPFKLAYEGSECKYMVSDIAADTEYWVRASLTFEGEEGVWTPPLAASICSVEKVTPDTSPKAEKTSVAPAAERKPRKRVWLKEEQKKFAMMMVLFLLSGVLAVILAHALTK